MQHAVEVNQQNGIHYYYYYYYQYFHPISLPPNSQLVLGEAQEGLRRAQKLLKMSKRIDYYKVLGVTKESNERDIKKVRAGLAEGGEER